MVFDASVNSKSSDTSKDSKIQAGFKILEITKEVKINLRISFIFLDFVG